MWLDVPVGCGFGVPLIWCPWNYQSGFYMPEDDILHSHRCENLKSYIALIGWAL
jgi:hypothetical protein